MTPTPATLEAVDPQRQDDEDFLRFWADTALFWADPPIRLTISGPAVVTRAVERASEYVGYFSRKLNDPRNYGGAA